MRKIICDWCGKVDNNCEMFPKWYRLEETIDLCNECEEKYYNISNEIKKYREKMDEEYVEQREEKLKIKTEQLLKEAYDEKEIFKKIKKIFK